ncbi:hypothetical protein I8D63_002848 [Vibrio parahaemolyticus]|nr:hypothetical protein [Vibrio parahaemolyticus]
MSKFESVLVLLSSLIQKTVPLFFGLVVLKYFGSEYYSSFSYNIVFSVMFTVVITAGLAPSLIKDVLEEEEIKRSVVVEKYISVVLFSVVFVSLLSFIIMTLLSESNMYEIFFMHILAIGVVVVSLLIPLSQSIGLANKVIKLSLFFFLLLFLFFVFSFSYEENLFIFLYSVSYLIFGSLLILILINQRLITKNIFLQMSINVYCLNLNRIFRKVIWIFAPNAIWMLVIFVFHTVLKTNEDTMDTYQWFALGYQLFSIIVFLPNSMAPIIIRRFVQGKGFSIHDAIKISLFYIAIALVFIFVSYFSFVFIFPDVLIDIDIVLCTTLAGAFSAGVAPITQYLISRAKAYYLLPAVSLFSLIIFIVCFDFLNYYYMGFLISYALTYIMLLIVLLTFRNRLDA